MEKIECQDCKFNPCSECEDLDCENCGFSPSRRQSCNYPCGQQNCWDDCEPKL